MLNPADNPALWRTHEAGLLAEFHCMSHCTHWMVVWTAEWNPVADPELVAGAPERSFRHLDRVALLRGSEAYYARGGSTPAAQASRRRPRSSDVGGATSSTPSSGSECGTWNEVGGRGGHG